MQLPNCIKLCTRNPKIICAVQNNNSGGRSPHISIHQQYNILYTRTMTHPIVYALGVGVAIGVAIFAAICASRESENAYHREQPRSRSYYTPAYEPRQSQQSTTSSSSSNGGNTEQRRRRESFQKTCTICLDDERLDLVRIGCGHYFHIDCLQKLQEESSVCPNCRQTI